MQPVIPCNPALVPASLRALDRWVVWKFMKPRRAEKKWIKVPFNAKTGGAAKTSDASTWASFDEAHEKFIFEEYSGLGIVLGEGLCGIDIDDCRDPGTGELSGLAREVLRLVGPCYAELSPSGTGLKIFVRSGLRSAHVDHAMGLEVYATGRYFTVTGAWIEGHGPQMVDQEVDLGPLVERFFPGERAGAGDDAAAFLASAKAPERDWTAERIREELFPLVDTEADYESWLEWGMALHHQFEGGDEGLELWQDLFRESSKYIEGEDDRKYASFNLSRGGQTVTLRSILHKHRAALKDPSWMALERHRAAVAAAEDGRTLREKVCEAIRCDSLLDQDQREELAQVVQARRRALDGVKMPLADARRWVGRGRGERRDLHIEDAPAWLQGWCWVNALDRFVHRDTGHQLTVRSFEANFNRFMPPADTPGAQRPSAARAATDEYGIPVVDRVGYLPGADKVYEACGASWLNRWDDRILPEMPAAITGADQVYVDRFVGHIRRFCRHPEDAEIMLDWMAWLVQNLGARSTWALTLIGPPGDGKTTMASIFASAWGGIDDARAVRVVSASEVNSAFTSWAEGSVLKVIEEMYMPGHRRDEVLNGLKPYLTNDTITVVPKGKDGYSALNTASYWINSNFLDSVPIDESDRRYCIVRSSFTAETIKAFTAEDPGYWPRLAECAQHGGVIRRFLMDRALPAGFSATGRAPETAGRQDVIQAAQGDVEQAARDILQEGAIGVGQGWFSAAHFSEELERRMSSASALRSVNRHRLFRSLGYEQAPSTLKWRGKTVRVWAREGHGFGHSWLAEARAALDASVEKMEAEAEAEFLA